MRENPSGKKLDRSLTRRERFNEDDLIHGHSAMYSRGYLLKNTYATRWQVCVCSRLSMCAASLCMLNVHDAEKLLCSVQWSRILTSIAAPASQVA